MHAGLSPRTVVRPTRSPAICGDPRPGSASSAGRRDRQGGAENGQGIERFAGPWSWPRPTRGPAGQPAYSQFVTQAASARGWFFAKIAEPATKTPITRVSATIFVMSPPRRELPESRGPTSMLLRAEVRDLAGGNAALVRVIQASRCLQSTSARSRGCADRRPPRRCV